MQTTPYPDTPYWRQYNGRHKGILRWPDLDTLWSYLEASTEAWFVFDPAGTAPDAPLDKAGLIAAVQVARDLVNTGHDKECSGAVYVDDLDAPTFIKVFDPRNMGTACGWGGATIMPIWIISLLKPDTLPPAPPLEKPGFWARIWSKE